MGRAGLVFQLAYISLKFRLGRLLSIGATLTDSKLALSVLVMKLWRYAIQKLQARASIVMEKNPAIPVDWRSNLPCCLFCRTLVVEVHLAN